VDRVFFRLPGRLPEDSLELEPALWLLDRQAEAAGEVGELVQLEGLGVGMSPPEEEDVLRGQGKSRRPSLAASMKLLDDLVALVVDGEVSADDLALISQVDLDLGGGSAPAPRGRSGVGGGSWPIRAFRPASRRSRGAIPG